MASLSNTYNFYEDVMVPCCNPLTLHLEQSDGVGLNPCRAPPLECHDKGSQAPLGLLYFGILVLGTKNATSLHFSQKVKYIWSMPQA